MVLRRVDMRYAGLEERQLKVAHLGPVDDLRVQIQAQAIDNPFDVVDRDLRVPSRVHVKHQRAQTEPLLRAIGEVGAVRTPTHADNAIEVPSASRAADPIHERLNRPLIAPLWIPVRKDVPPVRPAVVADAVLVERDLPIRGVHHALAAPLRSSAIVCRGN